MSIMPNASELIFIAIATLAGGLIGRILFIIGRFLPSRMEWSWKQEIIEHTGNGDISPAPVLGSFACGKCKAGIPSIPWIVFSAKCKGGHAEISGWLMMLATGAVTGWAAYSIGKTGNLWMLAGTLAFAWALILLAMIDMETMLLPDDITLPLLWAGLLFNLNHGFASLPSAVIGAAAGYMALWVVFWVFKILRGVEGLGYGDFKLLAAIGAWLGWQVLPGVVILSAFVGLAFGVYFMLAKGHKRDQPMPFGPYLAVAGLVAMFCPKQLIAITGMGVL